MRAISLFSGCGGFELGFDRAGIETLVQVEKDPWCLEVLARHWPHTLRVRDVGCLGLHGPLLQQQRDDEQRGCGSSVRNGHRPVAGFDGWLCDAPGRNVDLVYGGWPCQDLS